MVRFLVQQKVEEAEVQSRYIIRHEKQIAEQNSQKAQFEAQLRTQEAEADSAGARSAGTSEIAMLRSEFNSQMLSQNLQETSQREAMEKELSTIRHNAVLHRAELVNANL